MYHLLRADEFDAQRALALGFVQEVAPAGDQVDRALELAAGDLRVRPARRSGDQAGGAGLSRRGILLDSNRDPIPEWPEWERTNGVPAHTTTDVRLPEAVRDL